MFLGVPVAEVAGKVVEDAGEQVDAAFSTAPRQVAAQGPEFAVRRLIEVGVRRLSLGINDSFIAFAVLDHLGAALCALHKHQLPEPALWLRDPVTARNQV